MTNLRDEFLGYEKSGDLVSAISASCYRMEDFWPEKSIRAYQLYRNCFQEDP